MGSHVHKSEVKWLQQQAASCKAPTNEVIRTPYCGILDLINEMSSRVHKCDMFAVVV